MNLIIPKNYNPVLDLRDTEIAIKLVKDFFEQELAKALNLTRVSAPIMVHPESGLNDNLNGVERPVAFDVLETGATVEIVHSLAKWEIPLPFAGMNCRIFCDTCQEQHQYFTFQYQWCYSSPIV